MLYIGSDHGGFALKEKLKNFLKKQRISFQDVGAHAYNPDDDYPKYAEKTAREVVKNNSNLGILLCRSGQGVCMAANKISGVKAALCWNIKSAKHSRNDDNANILCLPADFLTFKEARAIVKKWLATRFSKEPRHTRRIMQIRTLERK